MENKRRKTKIKEKVWYFLLKRKIYLKKTTQHRKVKGQKKAKIEKKNTDPFFLFEFSLLMTKEHEKKIISVLSFPIPQLSQKPYTERVMQEQIKIIQVKNHAPNYLRNSKFSPLLHFSLLSNTKINPKESEPKKTKQNKNAFTINLEIEER